jgi:SAM-dependent methyltransferase
MRQGLARNELVLRVGRSLPAPVRERGKSLLLDRPRPRWGNLRRAAPFSERFGWDRGTPVDRVFIERFLAANAADVRGEVLEVKDAGYTERFGGGKVVRSHVLDVDQANRRATILGDLSADGVLPEGRFDCVILTQTLQYVDRPDAAVGSVWRALAPGGVALVTVPCIARADYVGGRSDLWRWTPLGLERMIAGAGVDGERDVRGYGNLTAATAFLMGLAAEELRPDELELYDPLFLIVCSARLAKP